MDYDSVFHVENELILKVLNVVTIICLCFTLSFMALLDAYSIVPSDTNVTYGHISANVKSEYIVGDMNSIPVKIGGPDTGLSVTLLSDDLNGLKEISSVILYSNNTSTQFNGTLIGNALETGDYLISLNNTTSLPIGHYRLIFENPKYNSINLSRPFNLNSK